MWLFLPLYKDHVDNIPAAHERSARSGFTTTSLIWHCVCVACMADTSVWNTPTNIFSWQGMAWQGVTCVIWSSYLPPVMRVGIKIIAVQYSIVTSACLGGL